MNLFSLLSLSFASLYFVAVQIWKPILELSLILADCQDSCALSWSLSTMDNRLSAELIN